MPFYLLLGLASFAGFSLIRVGRRLFYQLARSSTGVLNVMLGEQDDDQKLEELQSETSHLILSLLGFLLLVLLALALIIGALLLYAEVKNISWSDLPPWQNWPGLIAISLGGTLPFLIPFKQSPSGYSELAKLLHRMILDHYHLGLKLHQRELKKHALKEREDFVIISGLARAGTTSFMNKLAEDATFRSLNYSNMPFLLAPNFWRKLYRPKKQAQKERSHKDGIQISLASNEALEEYFWKLRAGDAFIHKNHLEEYRPTEEDHRAYLQYQALIRRDNSELYLAKNNNFLLRYAGLRALNPRFTMVLLFRDPLSQAASLLEKHLQYCELQNNDPFVLEYMDWLGHHEFGIHQKAFLFKAGALPIGDKSKLDYWLKIWLNYYRYALKFEDDKLIFIDYREFCEKPSAALNRLRAHLGLARQDFELEPYTKKRQVQLKYKAELLSEAENIYRKLQARSR